MVSIEGNTFICKSSPDFWNKEKSYTIKRNTVRSVVDIKNDGLSLDAVFKCTKVKIINTVTKESFCRKITDISPFGGWIIISW